MLSKRLELLRKVVPDAGCVLSAHVGAIELVVGLAFAEGVVGAGGWCGVVPVDLLLEFVVFEPQSIKIVFLPLSAGQHRGSHTLP